ncbi:sensor histidine kinase [Actinomadura roseirufa]|uniref:sensor histidine kinase n=1 Tax=Actinomadura roseirufa TaxID=2094049 RepID=UPI001040E6F3|nr:histidine kinase [Actinomadura roseirufa]
MTMLFGDRTDGSDAGRSRFRRTLWSGFGLAYLIPLVNVVAGYRGVRLWLSLLALGAFVALYLATPLSIRSWIHPIRARSHALLALFAVLCAGLPFAFGQAWIGMPIYLSTVAAMTLPMRWVLWGVGAATALTAAQCALIDGARWALPSLPLTALTLGVFMFGFRHARLLVQQLREARGEVARLAAADERLRIARDLHDLLGRSLSLIVLKSEVARRVHDRDPARTLREVAGIESVARESLADVRAAITGYRRRCLGEELDGARAALSAAEVEVDVRSSGPPLPDAVDALFGWAVREGVTNVVRHARARRVRVTVGRGPDGAALEIVDDGAGPADAPGRDAAPPPGHGLTGLGERVAAAGGTLESGRRPEGGFRLAVRVPLPPDPAQDEGGGKGGDEVSGTGGRPARRPGR